MSEKYILPIWLALMSVILFIMMGSDKRRAKRGLRRIPEARLFLFAFLGGAPGGFIGMRVFHHKTLHWYFAWGFPIIAAAQIAGAAYILLR